MPNKQSAKKEIRKSAKLKAYNKNVKDKTKDLIKKSRKAIEAREAKAKELVAQALKALDKAAQKGVIKKNAKNRKKSKLHKKFNQSLKDSKK